MIGALALALALVLALIRSLLIPIRIVRQGALDVANQRLPEAVAAMRDGSELPAFEAIKVTTTEEMGQLARAVDDLHTQARTLAGEQARLRVQVGHMFETLSRRSTSLIDQQLSLIERLESDEEDPKRLQSLFRLDHLAARMRRNSDSLLVLAGTSTRRGVSGSVSVSDAVRAAVSEVENYERIDIGDTSNDHVLGAVGSDLIHLVAEIVDNALSYSPPTSRVAIRGARTTEGGLLIEVADRGLGMPPKELAALNDQLAHGGDITADTARRMGLFVVGSLAKRHGIAVRLRRNGDTKQGVTVSVHLPAGLLADSARAERPVRPAAAAAAVAPEATSVATQPTSAVGGTTKAGLPTRVRGASGATPSPVPGAAKKLLPTRTPGAHGPTAANAIQTPAKPVIEGADAAVEEKATNGHATEAAVNGKSDASDKPQVNGKSAKADKADKADKAAPAEKAADDAALATPVDQTADTATLDEAAKAVDSAATATPVESKAVESKAVESKATEDKVVEGKDSEPKATETEVAAAPVATTDDAPQAEAAPAPQRSAAGLPVRKPRATGITEYREFEDAPSSAQEATTEKANAKADAPAAKTGRLSWLPGRAKAAAEAARVEAEAAEPRQMPSNLSAWLDHRAKIVEATKAAEAGVDAPAAEGKPDAQVDAAASDPEATDSTTVIHVPEEWVAEAADAEAATVAPETAAAAASAPADSVDVVEAPVARQDDTTPLPTRVPGATSAPAGQDLPGGVVSSRPAMRAHNTSFFGARRARDVAAATPLPEQTVAPTEAVAAESVVDEVAEPVTAVDQATEVAVQEPVAEVTPEATPEVTAEAIEEGARESTEVVTAEATEAVDELVDQPGAVLEAPEAVVEQAPDVTTADSHADSHVDADAHVHADSHVDTGTDVHPDPAVDLEPAPRTADLNDTPIFRAMMSRWLTDDSSVPDSASWSTNEADQAWSAAARIEETQPLEESAVGLPMRRPGSYLIPGAVDESDQKPAAPAASRRDPEAIRRNLNRHKNGVSSARTEAQDGTHREEADVHH